MSRRLTMTARARTDVVEVRLWYARIRPELARAFLEDLRQTLVQVRDRPESFPEAEPGVRRALCDTFPYKVYFVVRPGEVHSGRLSQQSSPGLARTLISM